MRSGTAGAYPSVAETEMLKNARYNGFFEEERRRGKRRRGEDTGGRGAGKTGVPMLENRAEKYYRPRGGNGRERRDGTEKKAYTGAVTARVKDDVVLCPHHWKKVARITEEGIELWCKSEHGHPVMLRYEDIEAARGRL